MTARAFALSLALLASGAPAPASEPTQVAFDWSDLRELFRFRKKEAPRPAASGPVFRVVSWNLQTVGSRVAAADRRGFTAFFAELFRDPAAKILAAQEIANEKGAETVSAMLSDGGGRWSRSFQDTGAAMDNGFFVRDGVIVECQRLLFADRALSRHPARLAHLRVGDFDFTLVTVHLAFKQGRAEAAVEELRHLLDWLREHLAKPGADPDVVIAGDFNLPTIAGRKASQRGGSSGWTAIEAVIDEYPMFRGGNLVALVDEPTSRSPDGSPANNYDHFLLTGHLFHGAYVKDSARRVPEELLRALARVEAENDTRLSDHLPISADFRSAGAGEDGRTIAPDGAGACAP